MLVVLNQSSGHSQIFDLFTKKNRICTHTRIACTPVDKHHVYTNVLKGNMCTPVKERTRTPACM